MRAHGLCSTPLTSASFTFHTLILVLSLTRPYGAHSCAYFSRLSQLSAISNDGTPSYETGAATLSAHVSLRFHCTLTCAQTGCGQAVGVGSGPLQPASSSCYVEATSPHRTKLVRCAGACLCTGSYHDSRPKIPSASTSIAGGSLWR